MSEDAPVYYDEPEAPPPDAMKRLSVMAMEMARLTIEESDLTDKLTAVKLQLSNYANRLVPDLMHEMGVEKVTPRGGFEITLKNIFRCSFPEDPEAQKTVSEWINDRGEGGALHKKITIEFSNSLASADQVAELIQASLPPGQAEFAYETTVHHSALGRIVRDAMEAGVGVPKRELSVFHQKQATIKRAAK